MPKTWVTGNGLGFTLLELMVVLTIMLLMTLAIPIALPHLLPAEQLRVETESLASALRDARAEAIGTGRDLWLTVMFSGSQDPMLRSASGVVLWRPSPGTVGRWEGGFASDSANICFMSDGSSSGGHFELSLGRHSTRVAISPVTGRVQVHP